MSTDLMTLIVKAQIERDARLAGIAYTARQGHAPVESKPGDWPGCSGLLRLYPSGNEACDCGDVVIEPNPTFGDPAVRWCSDCEKWGDHPTDRHTPASLAGHAESASRSAE